MKKIINFTIFLILLFFPLVIFAFNCSISSKVNQCQNSLKKFYAGELRYVTPGTRLKSFGDFPCIQDSVEKQYYQIALDEYFSEIDEEKNKYLKDLFLNKNYYFGKDKKSNYIDAINDIFKARDYFLAKYYNACEDAYREVVSCLGGKTSVINSRDFIKNSTGDCRSLADLKVKIFLEIAYDGLELDKRQILIDQKRDYDLNVKTKYDEVLDLFSINYSYIERLWKKWSSKTKNTLGVYK